MKKTFAVAAVVAALAVPSASAQAAAGPTVAQFKALQKQVKTLQAQVKTLQKFVPTNCTNQTCANVRVLTNVANFSYALSICQQAVIADEFQATWNVIDQLSAATQAGKTYFGPQTSITDAGACADLRVTRPAAIPPTVAIFSSLVALLTS